MNDMRLRGNVYAFQNDDIKRFGKKLDELVTESKRVQQANINGERSDSDEFTKRIDKLSERTDEIVEMFEEIISNVDGVVNQNKERRIGENISIPELELPNPEEIVNTSSIFE